MGKLGKPQKSRKHKKIKKTFDTQKEKDTDLAIGGKRNKLYNLPVNDEDLDRQDIPNKLKTIMKSRSDVQNSEQTRKKKNKKKKFKKAAENTFKMERGVTKPMAPIPRFVQGKREKDRDFIRRVELETHRVIMKQQMEEKYQMEIPDNNSNTAETQVRKKSSERKREKDKERKKKKVQMVKEKKQEKFMDFSAFKDEVAFGEVAMAPPSLTAKPRKADVDNDKPRPGKRSLLLKDMMEKGDDNSKEKSDSVIKIRPKSRAQRQAGQTLKRKYLSPCQKQITDFERQKAIDLYRKMKDKKIKQPR